MGVKFEELSSYYKLLFMFGDYGYNISAEMGKELDYSGYAERNTINLKY